MSDFERAIYYLFNVIAFVCLILLAATIAMWIITSFVNYRVLDYFGKNKYLGLIPIYSKIMLVDCIKSDSNTNNIVLFNLKGNECLRINKSIFRLYPLLIIITFIQFNDVLFIIANILYFICNFICIKKLLDQAYYMELNDQCRGFNKTDNNARIILSLASCMVPLAWLIIALIKFDKNNLNRKYVI